MNDPKPVLKDDTLYIGDNGACYCGKHSGCSARFTGHDISGQKVDPVSPADQRYYVEMMGHEIACESCGQISSTIHAPSLSATNALS